MEYKKGLYPNCSEWDEEVFSDYYTSWKEDKNEDIKEAVAQARSKDWD